VRQARFRIILLSVPPRDHMPHHSSIAAAPVQPLPPVVRGILLGAEAEHGSHVVQELLGDEIHPRFTLIVLNSAHACTFHPVGIVSRSRIDRAAEWAPTFNMPNTVRMT